VIAIIDYGQGNLRSIAAACRAVGMETHEAVHGSRLCTIPGYLPSAIILPGVGAFGEAIFEIGQRRLIEPLFRLIAGGVPVLGICLGMQLLMEWGEEVPRREGWGGRTTAGLAIIKGRCKRLPESPAPIPNVGWRKVVSRGAPLPAEESFYFAHSYACEPENPDDVLATTEYGGRTICAAVRRGNVMGVQFHPEKSGEAGLAVLREFRALVEGKAVAA
jgi:glutamine amidotransferase